MSFYIVLSRSVFFDEKDEIRKETLELIEQVKDSDVYVGLMSRSLGTYRDLVKYKLGEDHGVKFTNRNAWYKDTGFNRKKIIFVGSVKQDMWIAANNKALLINPLWLDEVDKEIDEYGFALESPSQLLECIKILTLETELFVSRKITSTTKLIAISNANKYYKKTDKGQEMIYKYTGILKYNKDKHLYALYLHYLSFVIGEEEFKDIDYWMTFPSSSGKNENAIYTIAKNTRYLFKNRHKEEILIRSSPARKSTSIGAADRIAEGASRHFNTINLNPKYQGKLAGKKIVILDDFVTHGASFETARNLLEAEGVAEITFIAIGTFKQPYQYEEYDFTGNLYQSGYSYDCKNDSFVNFNFNDKALSVTEKIYDILNNR
ncbi:phosphoribosyltransferase [Sporosarcina soli]|uniref:Phosphoribosyltransferase n=1 Tax=Sporosarcina soli TaxID=334736 RepID=A0ABW0TQ29_9BACL